MLHVQRNVHMLVVNGMNIAVQVGDDGVLLVDAATAAVAPQVIAAIRTLSAKPITPSSTRTCIRTTQAVTSRWSSSVARVLHKRSASWRIRRCKTE